MGINTTKNPFQDTVEVRDIGCILAKFASIVIGTTQKSYIRVFNRNNFCDRALRERKWG